MCSQETIIKGRKISSPFIMAPMVTFGYGIYDGMITEKLIAHYRKRAESEIGMIIVESACISEDGKLTDRQIGIWKEEQIEGHRSLTKAIHDCHVPVLLQLHHAGIRTVSGCPASPSDFTGIIRGKYYQTEAMTFEQIQERIQQFILAAIRAKEAGYDGIEIHCAHSYFLCGFLSPMVNHRTDAFGGDLLRRAKIVLDIISGIREKCGENFLISVRMGYDEPDLDSSIWLAKEFEKAGIDFLHISTGFGSSGFMDEYTMKKAPDSFPYNIRIWGAVQIKKQVNCPVIAVGGIREPEQAELLLKNEKIDFLALGRALLCDPEWVVKMKQKKKIVTCRNCRKCLWSFDYHKCPGWRKYHEESGY